MSSPASSASSLRIETFDEVPSAEEFVSKIEPKNVPAVFSGCISNWKAFSKWNPSNGGLEYLQERVGSSNVEAMLSQSAPVFHGDIRSHERVSLPFSTFIGYCKDVFQSKCYDEDSFLELKKHSSAESPDKQYGSPLQFYLAQVPILNVESTEKVQLETLREDIEMPPFLEKKTISSVNLWMNSAKTRSSTHYDPHHNLLCVVIGCKQVVLWPPSASPYLYPLAIYGEASNHSAVSLEKSNYHACPRAECCEEYSQKVNLHAGDALFIPEGWYHQVDSERLTTAVNFWWRSNMMSGLLEHMDSYYLRRILRRLIDREMEITREGPYEVKMKRVKWITASYLLHDVNVPLGFTVKRRDMEWNQMLYLPSMTLVDANGHDASNNRNADRSDQHLRCEPEQKCSAGKKPKERIMLHELDSCVIKSLHELVALVHERVNPSQEVNSTSANNLVIEEFDETNKIMKTELFHLKDDPIANTLWSLQPHALQHVFLAMAHNFPRTLEALVLHVLSPVGAEVLTRKFEEMDQLIGEEDRNQFYQTFYGVFDDQFAAMDVLLNGKESFSRQAYKNVLDQYLGIDLAGQNLR